MQAGPERALMQMWRAAIAAALPRACLAGHWPTAPEGRLVLIACGKAALPMAAEAVRHYGDNLAGIVIFPGDGQSEPRAPAPGLRLCPASHPVPDERSESAGRAALELASGLGEDDLLLLLLSGGGSSLMCLPAAGVSLGEKQSVTRALLACGASIGEINCVRKHLSRIKGGRLAQACSAPIVTLAISDVPGDDPATIASGPAVPDPSTRADARTVLQRHGIEVSAAVRGVLDNPDAEEPGLARDDGRDRFEVVASGMTALLAAGHWCREHGIKPLVLGDRLEDDAAALARNHARQALERAKSGGASCLLSGGETTVTLGPNPGRGGRNSEYVLALILALDGHGSIWALAADTDGIDGRGGHSGALIGPTTLRRARQLGLDAGDFLRRHDSASLFDRAGGLLREGPTGTNVNDFRAILINPGKELM
jgi:hydroxypyruvate reductase